MSGRIAVSAMGCDGLCRVIVCLLLLLRMSVAVELEPPDLTALAAAERQRAEEDLAAWRAQRDARRTALLAQLAEARAAVTDQRERAAAARIAATRLAARLDQAQAAHDAATADLAAEMATVAATGQALPPATADPVAALEAARSRRLSELATAAAVRLETRELVDRDGRFRDLPVLSIGALQEWACGEDGAGQGLLVRSDDGRHRVAGPLPDAALAGQLRHLAAGRRSALPLDVDGSLAGQRVVRRRNLSRWLAAGGLFLWPILAVGLAALLVSAERFLVLARDGISRRRVLPILRDIAGGHRSLAVATVAAGADALHRVIRSGLAALGGDRAQRESALEAALLAEDPRLERGLSLLAVLAAVAPLLGLLGTVTGMIRTFEVIAVHGTGNADLLAEGIAEALVTTQAGLLCAVPILLLHAGLSRAVDRRQMLLDEVAAHLLAIEGPQESEA